MTGQKNPPITCSGRKENFDTVKVDTVPKLRCMFSERNSDKNFRYLVMVKKYVVTEL